MWMAFHKALSAMARGNAQAKNNFRKHKALKKKSFQKKSFEKKNSNELIN